MKGRRGLNIADAPLAALMLRRRGIRERRVVLMIRRLRAAIDAGRNESVALSELDKMVKALIEQVARTGMAIRPPEALTLSSDELLLLGWLAESQRVVNNLHRYGLDRDLVAGIFACGRALLDEGTRLPTTTINGSRAIVALTQTAR